MSSRKRSKPSRERAPSPAFPPNLAEKMDAILNRLATLEQGAVQGPARSRGAEADGATTPPLPPPLPPPSAPRGEGVASTLGLGAASSAATSSTAASTDITERLIDALKSINPVRSNRYYVSDFDPSIHDAHAWCDEVDRARSQNQWDEKECLARVGLSLKGDARFWLREWTSNDRTWSNFKVELQSLCPRRIDVANILFDVMCKESDKYSTYADYARKSLLRLRIVKGLSDELLCAIIVRGIKDPQIRAAATNAKLTPETIVEFLSIYVKPNRSSASVPNNQTRYSRPANNESSGQRDQRPIKRPAPNTDTRLRCYNCNQTGHKIKFCTKRNKVESTEPNKSKCVTTPESSNNSVPKVVCTFCKKIGHAESQCFAKERSEARNKANVNFCREVTCDRMKSDVITAVISGVPTDVLIDSGSSISLISNDLVKHFSCRTNASVQLLRGLGGIEMRSECFVTLPIEFSDITLEVDLYVVPHGYLSAPVLIGTDVLNREGIAYIRTGDSQRIIRNSSLVNNLTHSEPTVQLNSINTPLCGDEKVCLTSVLNKYSEYFLSGTATTTVNTGEMHIRLTSEEPVHYRPYKLSYDEKLRVREIVNDLKEKGIIRESESPYASPILLVKKKDGSDRMVVDYRALNNITVKDRYPLPLIEDHIDRLGKCKYFTALDMVTGFHQIKINEDSIHRTAFVTPEGHYEYLKMPYGLTNAPVVYQRIISNALKSFIDAGQVLVYIDDVMLLSNTVEDGLTLLDSVLETLTKAGFSINLRKCTFLTTEVEYLGRTISKGQVRPSVQKIDALAKSPVPKTIKQVRQFLGLAGYFRRYIPGYATKVAPIASLTRKNVKFHWGDEQERARQEVISFLTSEPLLTIFDPSMPTEVHTDASSLGYGAVLMQTGKDGRRHAVAYYSKVTVGAEPRYHSYELETLAVVKALQHFRQYLVGKHFKVVTDCNALKMTQRKKDLHPRVARWWMFLQDYDFTLEYRKGQFMPHADYLSRNPVNLCTVEKPHNWAQVAQAADDETVGLLEKLDQGQLDSSRYEKKNNLLYYKYQPVGETSRLLCYVPKGFRLSLLRVFHDEHGHINIDKVLDLILKHFWFPNMRQFVKKYIAHCVVCLTHKKVPRAPLQPIVSWTKPATPFDTVHADALGPLPESNGYKYILIIIDAFTKYCFLYPMYRQESAELKRAFTNAISFFGAPRLIVCDRGRMFDSADFGSWAVNFGIQIHFITPEMHQENAQVERYCRTVLNMVRIEVNHKHESWSNVLWRLQLVLNVNKQKTTQCSALNLLIGCDTTTPVINAIVRDITVAGSTPNREAWREMRRQRAGDLLAQNQANQDARVNRNRKAPRAFSVNDLVFVKKSSQTSNKLDSGIRGPYRILSALPNSRYELRLVAGSYGKTTQAAAEYMLPWNGEWTPDTCEAFFECKIAFSHYVFSLYIFPHRYHQRCLLCAVIISFLPCLPHLHVQ